MKGELRMYPLECTSTLTKERTMAIEKRYTVFCDGCKAWIFGGNSRLEARKEALDNNWRFVGRTKVFCQDCTAEGRTTVWEMAHKLQLRKKREAKQ